MDFEQTLEHINSLILSSLGRSLRAPEICILRGTWQGWTYEQMAEASEYSNNYLMRDIAPKLWRQLSRALDMPISKTTFKVTMERRLHSISRQEREPAIPKLGIVERSTEKSMASVSTMDTVRPVSTRMGNSWSPLEHLADFYGYETELEQLHQWLIDEDCRIISLFGLSGIGKTFLAQHLLSRDYHDFDCVIWHSLHQAPTLAEVFQTLESEVFGAPQEPTVTIDQALDILKQRSIAIVLDGLESVLESATLPGEFRSGYEDYGEFLACVASEHHKSCVIVTSLENPQLIRQMTNYNISVQSLRLTGLSDEASKSLLNVENPNDQEAWITVTNHYQGHPLALRTIARITDELMSGRLAELVAQEYFAFPEIERCLTASFSRLSQVEIDIIYWLASRPTPISLSDFRQDLPSSLMSVNLLLTINNLNQRSLIEIHQAKENSQLSLSPMVLEYVLAQFISKFREKPLADIFGTASFNYQPIGALRLKSSEPEPVDLQRWFQSEFQPSWQSLEMLFRSSDLPIWRFRSTFVLRNAEVIKRCKMISLNIGKKSILLVLIIAIHKDPNTDIRIWVQVQSADADATLPPHLNVHLLNSEASILASVEARQADSFIQLPSFFGQFGESFEIQLTCGSANHTEMFLL